MLNKIKTKFNRFKIFKSMYKSKFNQFYGEKLSGGGRVSQRNIEENSREKETVMFAHCRYEI